VEVRIQKHVWIYPLPVILPFDSNELDPDRSTVQPTFVPVYVPWHQSSVMSPGSTVTLHPLH
jgi:hypothetical protein